MSKQLNVPETDRGFAARFHTADELNAEGRAAVVRGVVEIHIGEDVYADEWCADKAAAQAWVDAFDFDELTVHDDEPDFDDGGPVEINGLWFD